MPESKSQSPVISRVERRSFEKRNQERLIQNRSRPNPTCSKRGRNVRFLAGKALGEPHRRDFGIITPKLGSEAKNSGFGDFVIEIGLNIVYKW